LFSLDCSASSEIDVRTGAQRKATSVDMAATPRSSARHSNTSSELRPRF
jgi:hypothetical protein